MRFRKLRIAWSVAWGVVVVLLIALWVRSYSSSNIVISNHWNPIVVISHGQLYYDANYAWTGRNKPPEHVIRYADNWYKIQDIWNPDGRNLQIYGYKERLPIWPFVVCAVAATTFPWLRRLCHGFSLRTLLIAMTLACVVLGLAVYAARR